MPKTNAAKACQPASRRAGELARHAPVTEIFVQRFDVPFEYPVYFTSGVFDASNGSLADAVARREPDRRHRLFAVIDSGVDHAWPTLSEDLAHYVRTHDDRLELVCAPVIVPGGERVKNQPAEVLELQRRLYEISLDRQSVVLVIGGGAVQDMAGYAAATTHRGVRVVRLPTTVASQNDSGVGVKNGINAFDVKNFLGTFSPPFAVLNDLAFLDTLPTRDRIAGMSEAVKVALIRDAEFFEWLAAHTGELAEFDPPSMQTMIRRSAELHLEHIGGSGDPFEFGSAKPLDFGHWSAHKLESLTSYELRHGEAVAIGMAIDARYSVEAGMLAEESLERACTVLEAVGLRLWHDAVAERDATGRLWVLDGLAEFREHLGGELTLTMLAEIGRSVDVGDVDEPRMERAIEWLASRSPAR